ncbi:MAG TPA: LptA/OstA family protein [Gemmatimonadaceae bacterium]|nr:LptA/OstA family protein [Gemmatimonadaceae bacterium]
MIRSVPLLVLGVAALLGACARRAPRGPATPAPGAPGPGAPTAGAPAPGAAVPGDTAAARVERERAIADSLKRAGDTTAARAPDTSVAAPTEPAAAPVETASTERCILDLQNLPGTQALVITDPVSRRRVTVISGGIRGRCRNQDITIEGDSAESYEQNGLHILIGNVHYREPRVAIDADRATYYQREERLLLEQRVHAEMQTSPATIDGPRVEYYRAVEGIRDRARVIAYGRPRLTYVEKDSTGKELPPVVLDADVITGEGDSTFVADGNVELVRQDLLATGDSAVFDGTRNFARLMVKPVIESTGERPYTLRGRVIDLFGAARTIDRVVAIDSGEATSQDLTLTADTIDLRVAQNRLERAFAFGTTGAHARTPQRDVIADSLDVLMPDQRVRELRAIGKAYAESDPDSTKIRSDERDWLRGDTVLAFFDSLAAADTASQPDIRELMASGQASAFYQVASERGDVGCPGINYVRGRVIRLFFADGEVNRVSVVDSASGVYLEPAADTAARPASCAPLLPAGTRPPVRPPSSGTDPIRRPAPFRP